jgi:hypothetical protein
MARCPGVAGRQTHESGATVNGGDPKNLPPFQLGEEVLKPA